MKKETKVFIIAVLSVLFIFMMIKINEPNENINFYKFSSELMKQDWCLYSGDTTELNKELIYTYQLCEEYDVDFLTIVSIRANESQFRSNIKSCDFEKTGSRSTFQQTLDNIETYGKNYTVDEIAINNYKSTEVAIKYMHHIKRKITGEYRRIVAFNTGIDGSKILSWTDVENHPYLTKVLNYKTKIEKIYYSTVIQ